MPILAVRLINHVILSWALLIPLIAGRYSLCCHSIVYNLLLPLHVNYWKPSYKRHFKKPINKSSSATIGGSTNSLISLDVWLAMSKRFGHIKWLRYLVNNICGHATFPLLQGDYFDSN